LTGEVPTAFESPAPDSSSALQRQLFTELFTSLASLLRSYTALHGLHAHREATVEQTEDKITVIHNEKWLRLTRNHAILTWMRENGSRGTLELTESGTLRGDNGDEAMDLAAEQWARDLMLNSSQPETSQLEPPK
jgi:cell division inhibitor SulA